MGLLSRLYLLLITEVFTYGVQGNYLLSIKIKKLTFHVTATAGAEDAQVSRGGADTRFIDPETMKLTVQEHVYVIGELLDTDGICGGYNLMWAVITGMKAGFSIYDSN